MLLFEPGSLRLNPKMFLLSESIILKSLGQEGIVHRRTFFNPRHPKPHRVYVMGPTVQELSEAESFSLESDQITNLCYYELVRPVSTSTCDMLARPSEEGRFTAAQILCLAANIAHNGGDFLSKHTRNIFFLGRNICIITWDGDGWEIYGIPELIHMGWLKGDRVYRPSSPLAPKIMSDDEVAEAAFIR